MSIEFAIYSIMFTQNVIRLISKNQKEIRLAIWKQKPNRILPIAFSISKNIFVINSL